MSTGYEVLIDLTHDEQYPITPDDFPTITHAQMVNFTAEFPRPFDDKNGYLNIWIAKGHLDETTNKFHEAVGFEGVNIKIDEPEIFELAQLPIAAGYFTLEVMKSLSDYIVNTDRMDGTVIVNEYTY